MSYKRLLILPLLILGVMMPAVGRGNAETAPGSLGAGAFVDQLTGLLHEQEWPEVQVAALRLSAEVAEWPAGTATDAQAVALALSYYRREHDGQTEPGEIVLLARELAHAAVLMRQTGMRPAQIGRAAVDGIRDALGESRGVADQPGGVGAAVREHVLARVADQARDAAAGRGPRAPEEIRAPGWAGLGDTGPAGPGSPGPPQDLPEEGP